MQGFNVQIGADVKGFEAGMQKVQQATQRAQQSLNKFPNTTNQATQSLMNLSRVAQDAPYGFMGISNNLNPLFESFTRLRESTGKTSTAFKAMGAALTGPAGIGLAIGVVSSLLVSFGDKLLGTSVHFSKAELAAAQFEVSLKRLKQEVSDLKAELEFGTSIQKLALQFSSLKGGQLSAAQGGVDIKTNAQLVEGLTGKINSLSSANKTLRDTFISQQEVIAKVTGKVTPLAKLFLQFGDDIPQSLADKLNKSEKAILSQYQKRNEEIKALNQERVRAILDIGVTPLKGAAAIKADVDKVTLSPKKVDFKERVLEIPNMINVKIKDLRIDTSTLRVGGPIDAFGEASKRIEAQLKPIRDQLMKLKELGEFVGNGIANAFSDAFSAIGKGENPIRALGEALKSLVLDLIQAALRAFIVKAIVNAFAPGLGSIANGGALSGLIGGIPGFANGGQIAGRQLSVVGERGPELFVPSTSGRIIPNNQLNGITGAGFQTIRVTGTLRGSGRDMVAVISQENRYQNRNV